MLNSSGGQSGPAKGVRLSFLTPTDQSKFEQLFAQSSAPYGGNKIPANAVSELLRRSNLDNDSLAKIWDLASIVNAPSLTFPEFAVAMFLTSKKLTGQTLPASLPASVREETEIAMATIASTESNQPSQQLVNVSIPQQQQSLPPQQQQYMMTGMQQPQMTGMQRPQMTGMLPQLPMMTGIPMQNQFRPTLPPPPPIPQLPMQTGYTMNSNYQSPMQTGFQPSMPPVVPPQKPRLQNLDFAKKMMPNQNGVTNLLNPSLGTSDADRLSWKISPEDKQRYRDIFNAWEGSGSGFMSGDTAKDVFNQSQLPPQDLIKIWNLADSENRGSLDMDEFSIAMHLVYRKMNGFEIPSVLPAELKPPSSVLKKFVLGRRPPPSTPTFGGNNASQNRHQQDSDDDDDSPYNSSRRDYVSSSRRKGQQSVSARSYSSRYSHDSDDDDDQVDVAILEDLRRQISETKRTLDRMPKPTLSSYGNSASSKYSLEELKEKIRRTQDDLNKATRTNAAASTQYVENTNTLMGLLETQKSLQDEIQYLCNRDIPVLARQLRGSAAELRDVKVRHSRKNDGSQDFMAFIQPTGPGGSITESDRVRAKAKAMMAARKAGGGGSSGSSTDAGFGLRRAEQEKEEADRKADSIEREMEKSRTALLDMRGDLKYLEDMIASRDLEDKKRFEHGVDLSYELRRFIEQLDSRTADYSAYASTTTTTTTSHHHHTTNSAAATSSPTIGASTGSAYQSPSLTSTSSPKPQASPARPRTAEEIKKEAERRVQERLAAIQARRNPGSSPKPAAAATTTATTTPVSKPNEAEEAAQQRLRDAEREAQEMLRASVNQREEADRKKREAELERIREGERVERQRLDDLEKERAEEARRQAEEKENEERRRLDEEKEMEERRRQVLAKEEADRQARFDAIKREEEAAEAAKKAQHKPEHAPSSSPLPPPTTSPAPVPAPPPAPPAPPAPPTQPSGPVTPSASTSSNNPFAKIQQTTAVTTPSPVGSSQPEKPNEPSNNKRVSYNPFAAFSAFSATKGAAKGDTDSEEDDGWGGHDDSDDDENEFPAAGSAKNLAGMLFSAMSKRGLESVPETGSPKPNEVDFTTPVDIPPSAAPDNSAPPPPPPPPPPAPATDGSVPPPPPAPAPPAPAATFDASPSRLQQAPSAAGGDMRSALLSQIQTGTRLKKAVTNDRSASSVSGRVIAGAGGPSPSSSSSVPVQPPAEIAAPVPVSAPLSSGNFLAELQARTGESSPVTSPNAVLEPVVNQTPAHDESLPQHEYIALWDYPGSGPDDLVFSQDDIVLVRDNNQDEDWWFGTCKATDKTGYFPRNYVQIKPEDVPELNIKARALYDFEGPAGQGCLNLKMGESITILVKENEDWWKARSEDGSQEGLVPANYLEVV